MLSVIWGLIIKTKYMSETKYEVSFNRDQLKDISLLIEDAKQEMRHYWLAEQNRAEMRLRILGTILPHSRDVINDCKKYEDWIFGDADPVIPVGAVLE